jgi:hypothetical protein
LRWQLDGWRHGRRGFRGLQIDDGVRRADKAIPGRTCVPLMSKPVQASGPVQR